MIEASAGWEDVHVEHLVVDRLLRTKVRLEQLLVVTFTDKATGELRKRIRDLIERILKVSEAQQLRRDRDGLDVEVASLDDEVTDLDEAEAPPHHWVITVETQRKLERALFSFERAAIFTIHAFCRKVLVELAFDSGQLFEQELVDGRRAFRDAWRRTLRYKISEQPEFRDALTLWLRGANDLSKLERILYDAYSLGYLELQRHFQHEALQLMQRLHKTWDDEALRSTFEDRDHL